MSVRFDTNFEIKWKKTYCNNAFFFADGHSEKFESMSVRCDTNIEINLIKLLYNNAFFFADGHADNSNGGKSYFENKI